MNNRRMKMKDVVDGTSHSIAIGEDAARTDVDSYWANGNCAFAHHEIINDPKDRNNELYSDHPGGVHIGLADCSVRFLNQEVSQRVVDFLATRNGPDMLNGDEY